MTMPARMIVKVRVFAVWIAAFFLAGVLLGFGVALQWVGPRLTGEQWSSIRAFRDWRPESDP